MTQIHTKIYWTILNGNIKKDDRSGLVAISSTLEWLIYGRVTHDNEISNINHTNVYISCSTQEVKNIDNIENNGNIENGDNTSDENIDLNVEVKNLGKRVNNGNIENGDNTSELCNHSKENIQLNVGEVTHTFSTVCSEECDVLKSKLKTFWDLDTVGIKEQEISVYDRFVDKIELRNGRYEVKLPLKETHPVIEDNYVLAVRRVKVFSISAQRDRSEIGK